MIPTTAQGVPPVDVADAIDEDTGPRPLRRRRHTIGFVVAAVLLVLVLVAATGITLLGGFRAGGERVAQQYLDAIAAGDASTASRLGDPAAGLSRWGVTPEPDALELLADAGLEGAVERIAEPRVHASTTRDPIDEERVRYGAGLSEVTEVRVGYGLAGRDHRATLTVGRIDGSWVVLTPLVGGVAFTASSAGLGLVAGVEVPLTGGGPATAVRFLYPGVYEVGGPSDEWMTRPMTDLVVAPGGDGLSTTDIDVSGTATPRLVDALQAALDELVRTCAPLPSSDDACRRIFDAGAVIGGLLLPRISSVDGTTFTATGGSATVAPLGRVGEPVVDAFAPEGSFTIEDGAVRITDIR